MVVLLHPLATTTSIPAPSIATSYYSIYFVYIYIDLLLHPPTTTSSYSYIYIDLQLHLPTTTSTHIDSIATPYQLLHNHCTAYSTNLNSLCLNNTPAYYYICSCYVWHIRDVKQYRQPLLAQWSAQAPRLTVVGRPYTHRCLCVPGTFSYLE